MSDTIGKVAHKCKIAAGLFWADYAVLGAQVQELEAAGVDWLHIEVRDGKYMDFGMPRGGFDIIEATCASTGLEVEAQLQMMRPTFDVFDQLKELGVSLISLPIETTGEMIFQQITYIKEKLDLKVGVWAWQGVPTTAFEQFIHPYVDIIEYESRAPFWVKPLAGKSPHTMDPIMAVTMRKLHDMIAEAGMEDRIELMEDGGLNAGNVGEFIAAGMTVGEFSSPLLKGPGGKLKPGAGEITAAVRKLRAVMEDRIELMEDGGLNAGNVGEFIAAGMTVGEFSSPLLKGPGGKLKPGAGEITAAVRKLRSVMDAASEQYRTADGKLKGQA